MAELDGLPSGTGLLECIEGLRRAVCAAIEDPKLGPGDIPSGEETRDLLSLYAKLPTEDLRSAVLALLRIIVGSAT